MQGNVPVSNWTMAKEDSTPIAGNEKQMSDYSFARSSQTITIAACALRENYGMFIPTVNFLANRNATFPPYCWC